MWLSESGARIFDWIGCGMGLAILGSLVALDYSVHRREGLARELRPYVEFADGEPGISLKDRLDFAKRADLSD